jgi:hypothetical protein
MLLMLNLLVVREDFERPDAFARRLASVFNYFVCLFPR